MSVNMAKSDGVTVFTLTSDPESPCPPLCQILKGLCYSPVCCSVSQHLKKVQRASQSVLGALHVMIGLLNIGLGGIHWDISWDVSPFWLGGMYIFFGILCILSEKFPSPCLVILNVILNLAGVGFAIAAIVLYSLNIAFRNLWWLCDDDYGYISPYTTSQPHEDIVREKCLEGKAVALMLVRGINGLLVVLSVLELCVVISSAVLGIKALKSSNKRENKSTDEPGPYKPLLQEVASYPTV